MDGGRTDIGTHRRLVTPLPVQERAKILLVDDRPDKLTALEAGLSGLSEEILTARSGKDALRLVMAHEFAVILLDVNMPIMDGFETASLIRQRRRSERTPIIFISAINQVETHMTRGYSLGAVDYIFTPVPPEVLVAKVAAFVDIFKSAREIKRQAEWLRQEAEQRAASLEHRLDGLLNRLNVGVLRTTEHGMLLHINPSCQRLLGITEAAMKGGCQVSDFFLDRNDHASIMDRLSRDGKVQEANVLLRRTDGSTLWSSLSMAISTGPDGSRHIDGLIEDITSRKETESALMSKAEDLARSNAELEQFAHIASHDLQEPLRMVSSYSSLVSLRYGHLLDAKGVSFLAQVEHSAKRMQELVRGILSFSRIGKAMQRTPVSTTDLVCRVVESIEEEIRSSGAQIDFADLPMVVGDEVMLGQVFHNLICNALKFRNRSHRLIIRITAVRRGPNWVFTISDNGIGIASEYHSKIFGLFQRLHNHDDLPGTGLGLAICKKVVEQHGGTIAVESNPGQGSAFTFTIPASSDETENVSQVRNP